MPVVRAIVFAFLAFGSILGFARIEHIPIPESYERGAAGKDYCLNLAHWYVITQHFISLGYSREQIDSVFSPKLEYEFAHGWLTKKDMTLILGFIQAAPVIGPPRERLGAAIRLYCEVNREETQESDIQAMTNDFQIH